MEINYKNELFEIAGKMEMIVDFTEIIERVPKTLQDDSEDEVTIELNSVEVVIAGRGIDILPKLTDKQKEEFGFMESFGCTMRELPGYIDLSSEERGRARTLGIPYDSTNNELKDWIYYGNLAALNTGKTLFEEAKLNGDNPNANDFKPKFILRVDAKTLYIQAQNVIDVFRDLNLNNLNFVTSMEMPPKN